MESTTVQNGSVSDKTETKADTLLEPGQLLRPQVSEETIVGVIERLYGLQVDKITEQNSYDDRNYVTKVKSEWNNSNIAELWPHGYVFKVMNAMDSQKHHVEAEHDVLRILTSKGFHCPVPVLNVHDKDKSLEKFYVEKEGEPLVTNNNTEGTDPSRPSKIHLVRLLTFVPGDIFHHVPYTPNLLYSVGEYMAKLQKATEGYKHYSFDNHKTLWSMEFFPEVRQFTYAVKDEKYRLLATEILDAFDNDVVPNYHLFQKGLIHGDFNEQNLIVQKKPADPNQHFIYGVIDFSEVLHSYYLFDVAIAIAHFSVHSTIVEPLLVPGHILAGYLSQTELNDADFDALKVSMAGRYATSLVMGAYTYLQDPSNAYVLTTAKEGWKQLDTLWNTPKQQLYDKWRDIIDSYRERLS